MHLHEYKNTQTYLKSIQTHVKTHAKNDKTYVNNYICIPIVDILVTSRYIGMLFIPIEYYTV